MKYFAGISHLMMTGSPMVLMFVLYTSFKKNLLLSVDYFPLLPSFALKDWNLQFSGGEIKEKRKTGVLDVEICATSSFSFVLCICLPRLMQTKGELTRKLQLQNSDLVEVEVEIHCIVSAKMYIRALKRYQDPFFCYFIFKCNW